jgi:hypothetical protein
MTPGRTDAGHLSAKVRHRTPAAQQLDIYADRPVRDLGNERRVQRTQPLAWVVERVGHRPHSKGRNNTSLRQRPKIPGLIDRRLIPARSDGRYPCLIEEGIAHDHTLGEPCEPVNRISQH